MAQEKQIIYFRESFVQSILSDTGSFLFIIGTFWFNQNYINGNNFVDFILLILFISMVVSKFKSEAKYFNTKKDLIDYLKI